MKERIEELGSQLKSIKEELINYFKDKNIPLDERWSNFEIAVGNCTFNNPKSWIWHNDIIEKELNLCWYDDFYMERYSERDFPDIINGILENSEYEDEDEDNDDFDYETAVPTKLAHNMTSDQFNRLKEDMLQSGYSGFVFDW